MASFMLCPFLLNERCCDCLDLTSMVERVDAGEQEPLSPVHGAKFGMAPDNIQVGIGPGLQDDCSQLLAKPLQGQPGDPIASFLAVQEQWHLEYLAAAHRARALQQWPMRQKRPSYACATGRREQTTLLHVESFGRVRQERSRLRSETADGLPAMSRRVVPECDVEIDWLNNCVHARLPARGSLPFTKVSLHATTKHGGFLSKRGHCPARKPAWRIRRSTRCLPQMMPCARLRQA